MRVRIAALEGTLHLLHPLLDVARALRGRSNLVQPAPRHGHTVEPLGAADRNMALDPQQIGDSASRARRKKLSRSKNTHESTAPQQVGR